LCLQALTKATQQRSKQNKAKVTIYLCSLQGYPCGLRKKTDKKLVKRSYPEGTRLQCI
jgi:hypothetical protein